MKREESMPKAKHLTVFREHDQRVHIISVLYCAHLYMKCYLGISNFLEKISSLSLSVVFLYLFAPIAEEGFLISPCCSLELCIQMGNLLQFLNQHLLLYSAHLCSKVSLFT